jgi:hypothetical protein
MCEPRERRTTINAENAENAENNETASTALQAQLRTDDTDATAEKLFTHLNG